LVSLNILLSPFAIFCTAKLYSMYGILVTWKCLLKKHQMLIFAEIFSKLTYNEKSLFSILNHLLTIESGNLRTIHAPPVAYFF
jgi:hypothetical protein